MSVKVLVEDARAVLAGLPEASVHMCVTSPPYWALRKYGHYEMQLLWGSMADFTPSRRHRDRWWTRLRWRAAERGGVFSPNGRSWIGALGLEPTMGMYVEHVVEVFRAVRRVLRDDGTLWLNLGDSYASGEIGRKDKGRTSDPQCGRNEKWIGIERQQAHYQTGLPSKNLCMIPARVALALQADGWHLRSRITWMKRASMPESVEDRPASATEDIYLFAKSARYYYDHIAVRRPARSAPHAPSNGTTTRIRGNCDPANEPDRKWASDGGSNMRNYLTFDDLIDAWLLGPEPFPGSHFAVMPTAIPDRAIRAGTSERGCCSGMIKKLRLRSDLTEAEREMVYARLGMKALA